MKISVKKLPQNKRELAIEVSGDIVSKKFEQVYAQISQQAKIPGFRPGKVPRDILERDFRELAHQEVLKSLLPEVYGRAIDSERLDTADLPKISDVALQQDSLSFTATVEIKPQIGIENYKAIKIRYQDTEISEEEVRARLNAIKELRKAQDIDDALAKSLGYPNVCQLEKAIRAQIYLQKDNEQRINIEREIIKHLTAQENFQLPASFVEKELNQMLQQAKVDLALKGTSEEQIKNEESRLNEQLKPRAEERVRVYLLLEAVAKRENIPINEQMPVETMEFLMREASWQKIS